MRTLLAAALLCGLISADTLELKNGRLLKGTYLGGTQNTVRFQVGNQPLTIRVTDIVALTFERKAAPKPPPSPTSGPVTVLAGTPLLVRMQDGVDSKRHKSGHRFTAKLETPLVVHGRTVAPKGTVVYGRLAKGKKGGRMARRAELKLELTDLVINGQRVPITTGGYGVKGERQGTGKKVAVGAGIGAIADGSDGAKTGAAVGLAIAALTRGKQVQVPRGTLLEFQLKYPVSIKG